MSQTTSPYRVTLSYVLLTAFAVVGSWLLHEGSHYLAGTALGYKMAMTLNTSYPLAGHFASNSDEQWMSAAGPLVTIAESLVIFFLMHRHRRPMLYPFLFTCFYMRLLAGLISFLNPNDEARISGSLGLGAFTLPLLVSALLGYLVYRIAKEYRFSKQVNWVTFLVIMVVASAITLSDQFFKIRLL